MQSNLLHSRYPTFATHLSDPYFFYGIKIEQYSIGHEIVFGHAKITSRAVHSMFKILWYYNRFHTNIVSEGGGKVYINYLI